MRGAHFLHDLNSCDWMPVVAILTTLSAALALYGKEKFEAGWHNVIKFHIYLATKYLINHTAKNKAM